MFRGSYTAGSVAFLLLSTTLPAFCLRIFPEMPESAGRRNCPCPRSPAYKTAPASITETGAIRLLYGYFFQALTQNLARGLWVSPAYAGKSDRTFRAGRASWDHPRICGEKASAAGHCSTDTGSPPHMRGKGQTARKVVVELGITPAYAGKRRQTGNPPHGAEDHPRVCGEKTKKIP